MAPRRYGKASVSVHSDILSSGTNGSSQGEEPPKTSSVSQTNFDFSARATQATCLASPPLTKCKRLDSNSTQDECNGLKRARRLDSNSSIQEENSQNSSSSSIPTHFIENFGSERARLDDLEFILDGLDAKQSSGVRVNSMINLAELCKDPETRKALRAHSFVEKVLQVLDNAEGSLALSGAVVLYWLCRDSANGELSNMHSCRILVRMLSHRRLLEEAPSVKQSSFSGRPFSKKRETNISSECSGKVSDAVVKKLAYFLPFDALDNDEADEEPRMGSPDLESMTEKENVGRAEAYCWPKDDITTEHLSFLCCTILTQQHSSFRDSFRVAEGIPVVVKIMMDSMLALILNLELGESDKPSMRRMRRDLRFIESLTFMSKENQDLVMANNSFVPELVRLADRLTRLLNEDAESLARRGCRRVAVELRLSVLKVLVNLTNHNATGGMQVGSACGIPAAVALLQLCAKATEIEDYDALTLGIGLLINCVEHNKTNRDELASCGSPDESTVCFLIRLFLSRIKEDGGKLSLEKMKVDDLVVAAYTSVLVGCMIKDNEPVVRDALSALGERTVQPLVSVLDYFIACHQEADGGRTATQEFLTSLLQVLRVLGALL